VSVESSERPPNFGDGDRGAEAWADGGLVDRLCGRSGREIAFGKPRGTYAGGKRQPGKRVEFVVDVEGLEIRGGALGIRDWRWDGRRKTERIEDDSEKLVIVLVEAEESNLQIILFVIGRETGLATGVIGGAVFGGSDGIVVRIAGVVSAVVMVEGRNSGQQVRVESVQPGEEDASVNLGLSIAKPNAGVAVGFEFSKSLGSGS